MSDTVFNSLYRHSLSRVAELVQSCPASESHHHAFPRGLLAHTLEACANALRLRKGMILPVGASPEDAAKKSDLYTYTVFAASILHDIAKPLTDQTIQVYDRRLRYRFDWNMAYETLAAHKRAAYIRIKFTPGRSYTHHQHSALILLNRILPKEGYQWLQQDAGVYGEFLQAFSTDPSGPVHTLLSKGDRISVSKALGAQNVSRFASQRPLWMKMRTALRFLINSGELPLNRAGAAGWVNDRGLWLVSKRAVDAIRKQLSEEGHAGVPHDNSRMFDILAEGGLLQLNDSQKAVWRCRVSSESWQLEKPLSLLCLPPEVVWDDIATIPYFEGVIEPVPAAGLDPENPESGVDEQEAEPNTGEPALSQTNTEIQPDGQNQPLPSTGDPHPNKLWDLFGVDPDTLEQPAETASWKCRTEQPMENDDAADPSPRPGQLFHKWIETGINKGPQPINTPQAVIHILERGVFVVSPAVFKRCAKDLKLERELVQKDFQKLKLHEKNPKGQNWFKVRVTSKGKISLLKGWIIPFEHFEIVTEIKPNPYLALVQNEVDLN